MIQKPKGTLDLLPSESHKNQQIENLFKAICYFHNYHEMRTPIFERSEVFKRSKDDESDIVKKETYDFLDRGNRELTLRPEGTAGIVRALIENKLYANNLQYNKIYYVNAAMFRYERPQSGRYREHHQFGIESFGAESPLMDAEVIAIAYKFLHHAGIKNMVVKINTLGDNESRNEYKKVLVDYLNPLKDGLCEDCKRRITTNPLRVLDCKIDSFENVPKMSLTRNESSNEYFLKLQDALDALNIYYEVDETLVRGLDYYSNTVFEIQATIEGFGSKATLLAGGRYSNLVEELGGPSLSSVGFGVGIERLLLALEKENVVFEKDQLDCFVTNVDMPLEAFKLANFIRDLGYSTENDYSGKKLKNQLNYANKLNPKTIIVVAKDEYDKNEIIVKHNQQQINVKFEDIANYLERIINPENEHECSCSGECHHKGEN